LRGARSGDRNGAGIRGEGVNLTIEHVRFLVRATREGHHVKSRAFRTEVLGCDIEDGPEGTASYLIEAPNGGAVLLRGNRLSKGPRSSNRSTAISIGVEGVDRPTPEIRIESNVFSLGGSYRPVFVTNHTATPALLKGNSLPPDVMPLRGDGRIVPEAGTTR
jgi:hypothetical protein